MDTINRPIGVRTYLTPAKHYLTPFATRATLRIEASVPVNDCQFGMLEPYVPVSIIERFAARYACDEQRLTERHIASCLSWLQLCGFVTGILEVDSNEGTG